ncbi:MAG: hypothetical protein IPK83_17220 [Planctomycetes bacterium]|nr:hypothetical protein [Planctomycetota bacterium]
MRVKSCDVVAAILVALVTVSVKNFARADTWDGGNNTGGGWSTNANWLDNTEPTINDPAIFPTPIPFGDSTISCSATEFAASLTFNDSYSIGANFLQLGTAPSQWPQAKLRPSTLF